ncbi:MULTISPECIES: DUF6660 family protein [unclassified Flavobacterium]|uniref:DUF6660 family protein n=1 Tax=unclassified Flavobacterium TaxID=196869 RepID=UPI00235456B6|nr:MULTISPECIES: DUF6660 family protein [unclassified Flavobacterium]
MKWLTLILSFYFVLLASIPCADAAVNHTHNTTSKETTSNHDKHTHDQQNDLCSPFCVCNCCGAQIMNYAPEIVFNLSVVTAEIEIQLPNYQSVFTSDFYDTIWQPPQIV